MKSPATPESPESTPVDEPPGLPGFRTWRGLYWFVAGFFVAVVLLLAVFSGVYSG